MEKQEDGLVSIDNLSSRLSKGELPISNIIHMIGQNEMLSDCGVEDIDGLKTLGMPLAKTNEYYITFDTRLTSLEDQLFCIVDIEASDSNIEHGQIIEIGAILIKNCKQIDKFESLVYIDEIPSAIQELTGIKEEELNHAPSLASVLEKFRLFIKEAVFVAHNVSFDYNYISDSFEKCGFGPMLNRKLCTIDLAKKTIKAERYGLEYLREFLNIEEGEHHRAFWDANSAMQILCECCKNIPEEICTAEELIYFSKPNQKKRKNKNKNKNKNRKSQKV